MKRELAMEFSRATEAAALVAHSYLGRGNKNLADYGAVEAMRYVLNQTDINGEIVIGEGEIDEAPMLYIGEFVGNKLGDKVDIAVDPIEGTRMVAMGQANAMTTLAVGEKGSFLKAPDMYMEKICVGPLAKGSIDLDLSIEENCHNVAKKLNKSISQLTVITLDKPRHDDTIKRMQKIGVRVFAIPDGDVAASILTCMPFSEVDMLYAIGGAPEGVVSAAVIRSLEGDMQGRLMLRNDVKGSSKENDKLAREETRRCNEMDVKINHIYKLNDMAKSDNIIFSATGITKGDLLEGIVRTGDIATTETLLIRGKSRTIRRIQSTHYLNKKDDIIYRLVNEI